jgi:Zn-dependent M28 family amino/carboxypeptidase
MGARAILLVYDPRNKYPDAYASGLAEMFASSVGTKMISLKGNKDSAPVQIAFLTRYTADNMLKNSGYDLTALQKKIISEKKPASVELSDITVTFRTYIARNDLTVSNVIGIVEGSDPVLKNECIIYTAHFDHVGVNQNGEVFNGADDNASGSMALLEVAEAFMNLKKKPLRTIVFAWVNGEEKGLLGSQYYVSDPVVPLEKTLININLDMVGRSKMPSDTGKFMGYDVNVSQQGEIFLYTDQKGTDILDLIRLKSKEAGIKAINRGKDPLIGSSDYASFMDRGVPAIFFNSGDYPDLHSIRDDVEKIDFDKMEKVSKMVFLIGFDLANQKKRFVPVTVN